MKKEIDAIFFDIDGTIVANQNFIPDSTIKALNELKHKGIKLFIATGRPHKHLAVFKKICDFEFDGWIILNGQYCYTNTNECIYEQVLPYESVKNGLIALRENKVGTLIATDKDTYVNLDFELLNDELKQIVSQQNYYLFNEEELKNHKVYQIMPRISIDEVELENKIMSLFKGCKSLRWNHKSMDINLIDAGKSQGIDAILDYYQIDLDKTMAFGDGENDIDMLKHVAIGVAMGNAYEEVKKNADYITSSIEQDGIYEALKYFEII